ncbi:hypothetical protein [Gloeothece verrucosa]|uniref:Uncharacterized protein n=1 Tax=Gloeothece verrucosa (strain PCC 7822) TaxID=497965 RepID=E0UNS0_GLOV7|nr:hypothetical protein [Gloeothece verrucosa]ADN18600.1 hypothetical protein Cyan7822_6962 [Gloeothece verrucosa PCC 7822]
MTLSVKTKPRRGITEKIKQISLKEWFLLSWCALILNIGGSLIRSGTVGAIGLLGFSIWVLLALFAVYIGDHPTRRIALLQKTLDKYGFIPVVWLLSFLILFLDKLALPTFAQTANNGGINGFFFNNIKQKATDFLNTNANASGAVPILNFGFAVLQILMLLYIAWSIAKVIQAAREDEDWKQAAKTPLIVLFAVTAGDFAVQLI